jgi:TetR/AcrR family transcriptional regulator, transcriptional repressor of aconitase
MQDIIKESGLSSGAIYTYFASKEELIEAKAERRRLAIQLWGEALRNPGVLRTVRKGVDEPRKILTGLLDQARDRGDLSPGTEPEAMARVMIAVFQGLVLQLARDRSIEVEPLVETVRNMLIGRLIKRSPDSAPGRNRL